MKPEWIIYFVIIEKSNRSRAYGIYLIIKAFTNNEIFNEITKYLSIPRKKLGEDVCEEWKKAKLLSEGEGVMLTNEPPDVVYTPSYSFYKFESEKYEFIIIKIPFSRRLHTPHHLSEMLEKYS